MADYVLNARRKLMDEPEAQLDPQDVTVVRAMLEVKAPDLIGCILGAPDVG